MHFVHAYIVYQLLSRRIQRDLLLVSALLSSSKAPHGTKESVPTPKQEQLLDSRLYPAVVKLLDTIIQSLNQMRNLSIVDDSPDLASAVEARISFTTARRFVIFLYPPNMVTYTVLQVSLPGTLLHPSDKVHRSADIGPTCQHRHP
jgi:RNA-binding signal recognition particle 68